MALPVNTQKLLGALADNGWNFALGHGKDTGGDAFVTIEGRKAEGKVIVTWHTRGSGKYRLFSCLMTDGSSRVHDATLRAVMGWVTHHGA